jgi:DnaJ-class molecular chaperone
MPQELLCSEAGCTSPASGYIPQDEEIEPHYLCDEHFDLKQRDGIIVCFLNEEVCPTCDGRSLFSMKIRCVACDNTGVVEKKQHKQCSKCNGTGQHRPQGRPFGSFKKPIPADDMQAAALAA